MQKQEPVTPATSQNGAVALQQAVELMQTGASNAATGTEKVVRRYPLAAIGVALGTGIVIGVAARHLLAPKRNRSVLARLGGFTRLF